MRDKYEFLIVGSGAGGASLAKELAQRGKNVLVIERGHDRHKLGRPVPAMRYYDRMGIFGGIRRSNEGVLIWRAFMAGGTTVVGCGNGVRCLQKELLALGIRLDDEFAEVDKDLGVNVPGESVVSDNSRRVWDAAKQLGYRWQMMPKIVMPERCPRCGQCVIGCAHGGKWTAQTPLREARRSGADILFNTRALSVIVENGKARGVVAVNGEGEQSIRAGVVILAAGGLATPQLLQMAGLKEAGSGLFCDLLINTYGVAPGAGYCNEPTMTLVDIEFHEAEGFLVSTFGNRTRLGRIMEMGMWGSSPSSGEVISTRSSGHPVLLPTRDLMSVMTKIIDESSGTVHPDGTISKRITRTDEERLRKGVDVSKEILLKAGCKASSIVVSRVQGAHPGGTAGIGRLVDTDLQTKIDNLFVCDCSVLPTSPGLPPILTIVALAKRLAKKLAGAPVQATS